eukprot:COSAG05_NODE_19359_length_294_cov_0.523077_1_plen_31_part_01
MRAWATPTIAMHYYGNTLAMRARRSHNPLRT